MRNSDVGLKPDELLDMVRGMCGTYNMDVTGAAMVTSPVSRTPYSGKPMPKTKEEMEEHRDSRGSFGFYDPNRSTK
ncbi:MAG: hypothetical protein ABIA12_02860 [Candidatus Aenigmatarchaeota archaeon]